MLPGRARLLRAHSARAELLDELQVVGTAQLLRRGCLQWELQHMVLKNIQPSEFQRFGTITIGYPVHPDSNSIRTSAHGAGAACAASRARSSIAAARALSSCSRRRSS